MYRYISVYKTPLFDNFLLVFRYKENTLLKTSKIWWKFKPSKWNWKMKILELEKVLIQMEKQVNQLEGVQRFHISRIFFEIQWFFQMNQCHIIQSQFSSTFSLTSTKIFNFNLFSKFSGNILILNLFQLTRLAHLVFLIEPPPDQTCSPKPEPIFPILSFFSKISGNIEIWYLFQLNYLFQAKNFHFSDMFEKCT